MNSLDTDIIDLYRSHTMTFVTSMIKIYDTEPYSHKDIEWRIQQFCKIGETGIPILIYCCENIIDKILPLEKDFNIRVVLWTTKKIYDLCLLKMTPPIELPTRRNHQKDTDKYMALMNGKIDMIKDASDRNYWNTPFFAWMDFSMAYLFHQPEKTIPKIIELSKIEYNELRNNTLYFPGCSGWYPIPNNDVGAIINSIHWRFCGSFFLGDKYAIIKFYDFYLEKLPQFIEKTNKLVWEVNIWAWIEAIHDENNFKMVVYPADHNDQLLNIDFLL